MKNTKLFLLCTKELKDYLYSFRCYLLIAVYLFVSGTLISSYIGNNANTNIESVMPNLVLLFIFFIPVLVSYSFYKERKYNATTLFMTSSTNTIDIVLSKFISIYLIEICILFANFIQFSLIRFIDVISFRILISTFLGFLLLTAVLTSVSILICSYIKNSYVGFLASYGIMILLFLSTYFEKYIPALLKGIYCIICIFYDLNNYWYIGKIGFFPILHSIMICITCLYVAMRLYRKRCLL